MSCVWFIISLVEVEELDAEEDPIQIRELRFLLDRLFKTISLLLSKSGVKKIHISDNLSRIIAIRAF